MTTLVKLVQDIKAVVTEKRKLVGFVPTMGALHAGHISLIKASKNECKTTIVSIFVNPLQFSPEEDLERYPRDLSSDMELCEQNQVDYVFCPSEEEICSDLRDELIVPPNELATILCGRTRKNHFAGVVTIVKKLFDVVQPDVAYLGEKDLQQLYVIRWMVDKYKLHVKIIVCPTVRESSGLACSSRNKYLTEEQKGIASNLYKALKLAKQDTRSGIFSPSKAILESLVFLSQFKDIQLEYFEARDKDNLARVDDSKTRGFYYLVAAKVGDVRLIDNVEI